MPHKPPKPCAKGNCPNLTHEKYCSLHKPDEPERALIDKAYDAKRGTATARGYNKTWRKLRHLYLAENPLCADCKEHGRVEPGFIVDHIRPLNQGGDNSWDNLQTLCQACHNRKTKQDMRHG